MTMPFERTRALRTAGEFLREIQTSTQVSEALRHEATVILRHYPRPEDLKRWAKQEERAGSIMTWLEQKPEHDPI